MGSVEQLRFAGQQAIARGGGEVSPLPWKFEGTVFRCAWEYPVDDFEAEVGFYLDVLGFTTLALDQDYALFATPEEDLTFACRRHPGDEPDYSGHILCFMTKEIESFSKALADRIGESRISRVTGSPVQTVLRIASPAGLQIDIWEFPSSRPVGTIGATARFAR